MIACNRGESGSPDAGAGRRRRAARERHAISGLRSAARGLGSSGRVQRQRPDPLAGVADHPSGQADQMEAQRLDAFGRPSLAQREALHRGV